MVTQQLREHHVTWSHIYAMNRDELYSIHDLDDKLILPRARDLTHHALITPLIHLYFHL